MSESQQFTGIEWAEIGFGRTEQNTRQNRDARRITVVDLVAMAGQLSCRFGLRGTAVRRRLTSAQWLEYSSARNKGIQCFSLFFLSTPCPCASNDINETICTSMHVIYAAIETRVGRHPGHADVKLIQIPDPQVNSTYPCSLLCPSSRGP
jgi:hypothetical protein